MAGSTRLDPQRLQARVELLAGYDIRLHAVKFDDPNATPRQPPVKQNITASEDLDRLASSAPTSSRSSRS
jgi:hypothetical protein